MRTIDVTPEWPAMAKWFSYALAQHAFVSGATRPVASFIEIIAYLTQTNPQFILDLVKELREREEVKYTVEAADKVLEIEKQLGYEHE